MHVGQGGSDAHLMVQDHFQVVKALSVVELQEEYQA